MAVTILIKPDKIELLHFTKFSFPVHKQMGKRICCTNSPSNKSLFDILTYLGSNINSWHQ